MQIVYILHMGMVYEFEEPKIFDNNFWYCISNSAWVVCLISFYKIAIAQFKLTNLNRLELKL